MVISFCREKASANDIEILQAAVTWSQCLGQSKLYDATHLTFAQKLTCLTTGMKWPHIVSYLRSNKRDPWFVVA
jgi:hypothetical protein